MKIYTKTGDQGETGLYGKSRVRKNDLRIECIGAIDELNASIGVVTAHLETVEIDCGFPRIQNELFELGARIATVDAERHPSGWKVLESVERLESEIDAMNEQLTPLTHFVLPGGHVSAALVHVARTQCRRTERTLVALEHDERFAEEMIYLNRLSDWLFVVARFLNQSFEVDEPIWRPSNQS